MRPLFLFVSVLFWPHLFYGQTEPVYRDTDEATNILSMQFIGEAEAYVATNGWVGYSSDSGRSFQHWTINTSTIDFGNYQVDFSAGFNVKGIGAIDKNNAFVYGQIGQVPAILKTTNLGASFKLVYYGIPEHWGPPGYMVNSMAFPGYSDRAVAIIGSTFLSSFDKGETFQITFVEPDFYEFRELITASSRVVYAYGEIAVYKSTDSGTTWAKILPPGGSIWGMSFISETKGFALNGPYLHITTDGYGWDQVGWDPLPQSIAIVFISDSVGFMPGPNFSTLKTSDGGLTWAEIPRSDNFTSGGKFHRIMVKDIITGTVYMGGGHGYIERIKNGGGAPIPVICDASFTISADTNTVKILAVDSGPNYQHAWDMGDGTLYNDNAEFIHHYSMVGTYRVTHIVNNRTGCVREYTDTVVIGRLSNCTPGNIMVEQVALDSNEFRFRFEHDRLVERDAVFAYAWNLGDGATGTSDVVTHRFTQPGEHAVCVKITNTATGCMKEFCTAINVKGPADTCLEFAPVILYNADPSDPLMISFRDSLNHLSQQGIEAITWHFGDGSSSNLAEPVYRYQSRDLYQITLTYSTPTGCSRSASINIDLREPCRLNASFNITEPVSDSLVINFINTSDNGNADLNYIWDFGDGTNLQQSFHAAHTYAFPGEYYVSLTARSKDGRCEAQTWADLRVKAKQPPCDLKSGFTVTTDGNDALFKFDTSSTLAGNSWLWSFGDGTTSTALIPLHRYDSSGSYLACLTVRRDNNCFVQYCDSVRISYSALQMIRIYPNPAQGQVRVQYFSQTQEPVVIDLVSETGTIMYTIRSQALHGSNYYSLDLSNLKPGIYIVRISTSSGKSRQSRVVKL